MVSGWPAKGHGSLRRIEGRGGAQAARDPAPLLEVWLFRIYAKELPHTSPPLLPPRRRPLRWRFAVGPPPARSGAWLVRSPRGSPTPPCRSGGRRGREWCGSPPSRRATALTTQWRCAPARPPAREDLQLAHSGV